MISTAEIGFHAAVEVCAFCAGFVGRRVSTSAAFTGRKRCSCAIQSEKHESNYRKGTEMPRVQISIHDATPEQYSALNVPESKARGGDTTWKEWVMESVTVTVFLPEEMYEERRQREFELLHEQGRLTPDIASDADVQRALNQ